MTQKKGKKEGKNSVKKKTAKPRAGSAKRTASTRSKAAGTKTVKKKAAKEKTAKTSAVSAPKRKAASATSTRKAAPKKAPAKKKTSAKTVVRKATSPRRSLGGAARPVLPPLQKKKLTAREREQFRKELIAWRVRLSGQINSLKSEALTRNDSYVSMEDGTDAFDRQFGLSLVSSENDALFEVDEALRRLDLGTYGVCEECNDLVEMPRLRALPFVKTCISCQSEIEKRSPGFTPTFNGIR